MSTLGHLIPSKPQFHFPFHREEHQLSKYSPLYTNSSNLLLLMEEFFEGLVRNRGSESRFISSFAIFTAVIRLVLYPLIHSLAKNILPIGIVELKLPTSARIIIFSAVRFKVSIVTAAFGEPISVRIKDTGTPLISPLCTDRFCLLFPCL